MLLTPRGSRCQLESWEETLQKHRAFVKTQSEGASALQIKRVKHVLGLPVYIADSQNFLKADPVYLRDIIHETCLTYQKWLESSKAGHGHLLSHSG